MKKLLVSIIALALITACRQQSKQDNDDAGDLPQQQEKPVSQSDTISAYRMYLQRLDTSKIEAVSMAARRFRQEFAKADTLKADSAFILFNRWYSQMEEYLNEKHLKDPSSDAGFFNADDTHRPDEEKLAANREKLEKNGFMVTSAEGTTYIKPDPDFLYNNFAPYLSQPYKQYLQQLSSEDRQGYLKNSKLSITPVQLADRVVWREHFLLQYPDFIYKQKLLESQKEFTTFLLDGVDPEGDGGGHQRSEYLQCYEYVMNNHPDTRLAMIIKPYYNAIKSNDTPKVQKLLKRLRRKGIIYDYSA